MKLGKIALAALIVFIIGGIGSVAVGFQVFSATPTSSDFNKSIPLDGVNTVEAVVKMGVGDLTLHGGTEQVMAGDFSYSENSGPPIIKYDVNDREGKLKITRKDSNPFWDMDWLKFGEVKNDWNVQLNEKVKLDLQISTGVGTSDLDLSKMNLNHLNVNAGVGDTKLDLSGDYKNNVDVKIDSGVGELELIIPENIGVRIKVDSGVGSVELKGLSLNGAYYENDAYNESDIKMTIDLDMGVGDVEITSSRLK